MNTDHTVTPILRDPYVGRFVASQLSMAAADIPYEVSERLRAARVRAVAVRKREVVTTPARWATDNGGGTLTLGGEPGTGLWGRLASALPLLALVAGLFVVNALQNDARTRELAEVDTALLVDDLPPSAYTDPGFTQYLKVNRESQ